MEFGSLECVFAETRDDDLVGYLRFVSISCIADKVLIIPFLPWDLSGCPWLTLVLMDSKFQEFPSRSCMSISNSVPKRRPRNCELVWSSVVQRQ